MHVLDIDKILEMRTCIGLLVWSSVCERVVNSILSTAILFLGSCKSDEQYECG